MSKPSFGIVADSMPTSDAGWILDYAKYRYDHVVKGVSRIESKAKFFLRACGWLSLLVLVGLFACIRVPGNKYALFISLSGAMGSLLGSCFYLGRVLKPGDWTSLPDEKTGIEAMMDSYNESDPLGTMAMYIGSVADDISDISDRKGRNLGSSYSWLCLAIIFELAFVALIAVR